MTNDLDTETDGGYISTFAAPPREGHDRSRYRQVLTVARTEYRLALRSQWAIALTGLFAFFGLMLATFSGSAVSPAGIERIVGSFTSLATYLVPLAALVFGYDAIVGRDEEGWLSVVFALPVTRARVVFGMYVGRAFVLTGAMVIGFGIVGVLLLEKFGVAYWNVFLVFLAGTIALGAVFLAIALLVSSIAREKAHALGLALLVWVWFVLVHDLLALGIISAFQLPNTALTGLVLANPVTVFRILVLSHLGATGAGGFAAALTATDLSVGLLATTLGVWCAGPLIAAILFVRHRRL